MLPIFFDSGVRLRHSAVKEGNACGQSPRKARRVSTFVPERDKDSRVAKLLDMLVESLVSESDSVKIPFSALGVGLAQTVVLVLLFLGREVTGGSGKGLSSSERIERQGSEASRQTFGIKDQNKGAKARIKNGNTRKECGRDEKNGTRGRCG